MEKLKRYAPYGFIIAAIFIFGLFYFISSCTPVAGDDWGYALNGLSQNPFISAYEFYFSWSGRVFSELWGFLVAPNKQLWNILNACFFTIIFIFSYRLIKPTKNQLFLVFVMIALILSVDDNVRMETYTWIMGTTYVIPLMLALIYFYIINEMMENSWYRLQKTKFTIITSIILFYIGLTMENIAATMIVATAILVIYSFFEQHKLRNLFVINLITSIVSFVILRLSPGASARLVNDHPQWSSLNIFEKFNFGYPQFIQYTFLNNDYLIGIFALIISLLVLTKWINKCKSKIILLIILLLQALAFITVFSFALGLPAEIFAMSNSLYNMIFWPVYILFTYFSLFYLLKPYNCLRSIYFLTIAGTANLVMIFSPIFGARSSIYFIYLLIIVIGYLLHEVEFIKYTNIIIALVFVFIIYDRTSEYLYKYQLVKAIQNERLEIYQYYQGHPEDEDVWIPRMPPLTVHGSDIEPDDTYHLQVFKQYYNLPQDWQNIQFFWKEGY